MSDTKTEVNKWDEILDEYEKGLGLPKYQGWSMDENELNEYLTMSRTEVEKLDPEDCAQISYRLGQFSFFIQRSSNREQARHNWAEETIKNVIADEINSYKGYGYVEKSAQAIKHNEKANNLYKISKYAKQRLDRLYFLAASVKNLSDIMISIQRLKVSMKNG